MTNKNIKFDMDEIKQLFEELLENNNKILLNKIFEVKKKDTCENNNDYQQQITLLNNENKELKNKYNEEIEKNKKETNEYEEKINRYAKEISEYKKEINSYKKKIEDSKKIIENYKNQYAKIETAKRSYEKLSTKDKDNLKNILPSDEAILIIGKSTNWDNVDGMWNYIKSKVQNNEIDEIESYTIILKFMFDVYNSCNPKKKHFLTNSLDGERYDSDKHVIMGAKTDGVIKRVLLPGVIDANTQKVEKKALIEV